MPALHLNFLHGTIGATTDTATTLASTTFSALPELLLADGNYLRLTIDPGGPAPEIVHLVAHDTAATEATVVRAQEGTVAAAWPPDTEFRHAITADDIAGTDTIWVYDETAGEYVRTGGRTYIGPVDPATLGAVPDGYQWKDTTP